MITGATTILTTPISGMGHLKSLKVIVPIFGLLDPYTLWKGIKTIGCKQQKFDKEEELICGAYYTVVLKME